MKTKQVMAMGESTVGVVAVAEGRLHLPHRPSFSLTANNAPHLRRASAQLAIRTVLRLRTPIRPQGHRCAAGSVTRLSLQGGEA